MGQSRFEFRLQAGRVAESDRPDTLGRQKGSVFRMWDNRPSVSCNLDERAQEIIA